MPGEHGSQDGTGSTARFLMPTDVAIDRDDNLYVTDQQDTRIRKVTPAGAVTTVAGLGGAELSGYGDVPVQGARFFRLAGIAVDGRGNIYVGDMGQVRRISPDGWVKTIVGTLGGDSVRLGDKAPSLMRVSGLAMLGDDRLVITDSQLHSVFVLQLAH
jgi:sugar lactone lactonase YvrE